MVANHAGGFVFGLDAWKSFERFLILGVDGPTYYVDAQELTRANADVVMRVVAEDGLRAVAAVVAVMSAGRAPKVQPALFALAVAASSEQAEVRTAALSALPEVARTGTQLFQFVTYAQQFRGWGRALRTAVGAWYLDRSPQSLARQLTQYRQRDGWTHRDMLRRAHPAARDAFQQAAFSFAVGRDTDLDSLTGLGLDAIEGFLSASTLRAGDTASAVELVTRYKLSWEMLPDEALTHPEVWEALVDTLGQSALLRNLPRMSRVGLLTPGSKVADAVCAKLVDSDRLRSARIHPVSVLNALVTYRSGQSTLGKSSWEPSGQVVDALDAAFYAAFGSIEPAGKKTMLAIDVSGSMTWGKVAGSPVLTPRDAAAAMALVTAATEPYSMAFGFSTEFVPLTISPRQRLDDVVRTMEETPMGGTDCAVPMLWAARERVEVETFCVYTDCETWAGAVHPMQALRAYRDKMGIAARLVVFGLEGTPFSIADPTDPGSLDVVGLDAAAPSVVAAFSRGDL
jgi:60 kDa SS-A/Ro ribonucleoprotein